MAAGIELVRFAKRCGLIRGEWIAIDGSKFRAVASIDTARERLNLQKYLDSMEKADEEQQPTRKFVSARRRNQHARRVRSPELQQLIRVDVDRDSDVFGKREFVERFADEAA